MYLTLSWVYSYQAELWTVCPVYVLHTCLGYPVYDVLNYVMLYVIYNGLHVNVTNGFSSYGDLSKYLPGSWLLNFTH